MEHRTSGILEDELRHALQYLYDPCELRKNRLLSLLCIEGGASPLTQLRRTLTDAIEALKPDSQVPAEAQAWRIYNILTCRYVEQLSQREAANDLCLSVRQLRRDEHAAVRVLTDHLLHHYNVQPEALVEPGPAAAASPGRSRELEWLRQTLPNETMDVRMVVNSVVTTAVPLTEASRVRIDVSVPPDLPAAVGQTATVRQALLNLLSVAAPAVPGGRIEISAKAHLGHIELTLCVWCEGGNLLAANQQMADTLALSQQLVELGGGTLSSSERCAVTFLFPTTTAQHATVLIIDDNADTLQLFHRHLAGTRFEPVSISVPEEALDQALEVRPDLIVLDVMLPGIDGWELLGRIREHPTTRDIPLMMCTILPQEKLALALGADAFLQKPFTRESLFAALTSLVNPPLPGDPSES